jgi:sirohydrochlorin ferrochelatase
MANRTNKMTGIVVWAHGSRVEAANEAVRRVAEGVARAGGHEHVEAAFLELGQPNLEGAVVRLMERGVGRVLVVPYFLTLGIHLERDLPSIVRRIEKHHPGVQIRTTPPLDGHAGLVAIVVDRASVGLGEWEG